MYETIEDAPLKNKPVDACTRCCGHDEADPTCKGKPQYMMFICCTCGKRMD